MSVQVNCSTDAEITLATNATYIYIYTVAMEHILKIAFNNDFGATKAESGFKFIDLFSSPL